MNSGANSLKRVECNTEKYVLCVGKRKVVKGSTGVLMNGIKMVFYP